MLERSSFHFVGIGGIGMSGLAELLLNMGAQITIRFTIKWTEKDSIAYY